MRLVRLAAAKGATEVEIKDLAIELLQPQHEGGIDPGGVPIDLPARPHIPERDDLPLRSCHAHHNLARKGGNRNQAQPMRRQQGRLPSFDVFDPQTVTAHEANEGGVRRQPRTDNLCLEGVAKKRSSQLLRRLFKPGLFLRRILMRPLGIALNQRFKRLSGWHQRHVRRGNGRMSVDRLRRAFGGPFFHLRCYDRFRDGGITVSNRCHLRRDWRCWARLRRRLRRRPRRNAAIPVVIIVVVADVGYDRCRQSGLRINGDRLSPINARCRIPITCLIPEMDFSKRRADAA